MPDIGMDRMYMKRCLQLAINGKATCSPNPMVGAVVVYQGRIIGEGWHRRSGDSHAEPNAIRSVKNQDLLKESTLYVNLEPCSHHGKTPPCAELIIEKKIPRVVIGCLDTFPLVAGRGVSKLRAAGVDVTIGVEEAACLDLNRAFFLFHKQERPYILLKWAQTADGYLDILRKSGDEKIPLKISNSFTQMLTHKMRTECDAILVGTNTALLDNPSLNVRFWFGKHPVRVVIDRQMCLPLNSVLLDGKIQTFVFTEKPSKNDGKTSWIHLDFGENTLQQLLNELYKLNLQTLLVEGGAHVHNSFLKAGLWDEIRIETSIGNARTGVVAPDLSGVLFSREEKTNYDVGINSREIRIIYSPERS